MDVPVNWSLSTLLGRFLLVWVHAQNTEIKPKSILSKLKYPKMEKRKSKPPKTEKLKTITLQIFYRIQKPEIGTKFPHTQFTEFQKHEI